MKQHLLQFCMAFILLITISTSTKASHLVGTYITYEYAGTPNQYIVKLHLYGCGGAISPPYPFICYSSLSLGFSDTISLPNIYAPGNIASYSYCNGNLIDCLNSGLEEYVCSDTVTLPQAAIDWKFQFSQCCRNALGINLFSSTLAGMLVTTTLDNLTYPVNSSPEFSDSLIYFYCVNQPSIINYNCIDADGDSLVYSLVPVFADTGFPFQCPYQPVQYSYNTGYSPSVPLASSTTIMFDTTGLLAFTPSVLQIGQVGIKIDEYRNGILIGSVHRDDQVRVPEVFNSIDENNINNMEVYPNPFNSSFTVKFNTPNFYNIQLLDVTGRLLLSKSIRASETFNMNKLSKGIYIYRIYDDNGNTCIGKLVKN